MSKIFLTDVDGILFNFIKTFEIWIKTKTKYSVKTPHIAADGYYLKIEDWLQVSKEEAEGLIDEFFNTDFSKHFITFHDSIEAIKKIKNDGWTIIAVTAIGGGDVAKMNRQLALDHHYGEYVFSDVVTVPPFSSKENVLKSFSPTLWVDDSPSHITEGLAADHMTFHMKRDGDVRKTPDGEGIVVVSDWDEIIEWMKTNELL